MESMRKALRILLVEDSADDEELVRLALSEAELDPMIMRVSTRAAVEACLTEARWDLILCDHNLPCMDSLDVLQIVGELRISTPFVILSGSIPDEQAIEAMRRGARDFIHKDAIGKLAPVIERELTTIHMAEELHRLSSNLDRLADFDRLTGLPNRDNLLRYLSQRVEASSHDQVPFCLLLLDVNRFRHINRTLGPSAGNLVIAEVARRIMATAGGVNFVARTGGDCFALVTRGLAEAASVQAVVAALAQEVGQPMHIGSYELFITFSIGACCFPVGTHSAETLFTHAEIALFNAKQAGGNNHRLYCPSMAGTGTREIVIEGALHRALKNREFVLYYQPQIDLVSGRMVSVEALLRWQHPEWGLIPPMEFIPLLEETGLIVPVGEWIIESACAQLRTWEEEGMQPLRMAVNLSALQFGEARLVKVVAEALQRNHIDADRLELEITESIVMQGKDEAIVALQDLRQLGVRIAVDDFGTGYSSLGYLKRFPITTLKIDQIFVRECHESAKDQAMIEAIIAMGHRLGLEIVAEGVERPEQAEFLAANGCDLVQGYLFGKPTPPTDLGELLRKAEARRSFPGAANPLLLPQQA